MGDEANTLMYVMVHEVSHILCPNFGHTPLFSQINSRMLQYSIKFELYDFEDYKKNPKLFGEIDIKTNILQ